MARCWLRVACDEHRAIPYEQATKNGFVTHTEPTRGKLEQCNIRAIQQTKTERLFHADKKFFGDEPSLTKPGHRDHQGVLDKAIKGPLTPLGFVSFTSSKKLEREIHLLSKNSTYISSRQFTIRSRNQQHMRNLYRRICHHTTLGLAIMENHVHKILNKFRPAFGLLRNFRGTLPIDIPKDIESGPPDVIRYRSQDNTKSASDDAPQPPNAGSSGGILEGSVPSPAAITKSGNGRVENEMIPERQFTEGPSRFILANDGSKDCVALLVNETFIAKLSDLFRERRDVSALDGPLYHANMDAKNIENSIRRAQISLETAESQEQAEEYERLIEKQTSDLFKIHRWKGELEKERGLVNGNLDLSRSHTQWVLETAMREADLLGPETPLPAILLRGGEIDDPTEEVLSPEHAMATQSSAASVESDHEEVELSEEERQRRAAYDDFVDRLQLLNTVQAQFDNQQNNYRDNLAKFQQEVEAGTSKMSRGDFDRRSVQYGQQLTRALIDAEEVFEEARERAQDLGAIGSDYEQDSQYGSEYEESWPENKIADFNASYDWSFVEGWMDNIPDSSDYEDADSVEIDEWDAEEVDVNDSISNIDCEDYRQDIDRYRRVCARLEDPCPEARWLGQPDAQSLERRYSCWM